MEAAKVAAVGGRSAARAAGGARVARRRACRCGSDMERGAGRPGERAPGCARRKALVGAAASAVLGTLGGTAAPRSARAALPLDASPLVAKAALQQVQAALVELVAYRDEVRQALAVGGRPDLRKIARGLRSGEIGAFRKTALAVDAYVGPMPLEDWEKATWATMPDPLADSAAGDSRRGGGQRNVPLPWLDRPNAVVCAVVSCMDDPRQLASTSAVATIKMLQDAADLAARGDRRASAESMLFNFADSVDKLGLYIDFATKEIARREALAPGED